MSSDIEKEMQSSRAFRFQALRNFQRGMWIACYFSLVVMMFVGIVSAYPEPFLWASSVLGFEPWRPVVLDSQLPVWIICLGYAILTYSFWELKEDYEEEFVEYLLADFLVANIEITHEGSDGTVDPQRRLQEYG
ncbi:hypothetical protein [Natronolimnohabitans innermongolicus]|uniref:Uncharacterized protein n=1 Tax=Natronolimnohabitans innermongolicus JCM 12255 TaxID=1227499 RepID=L9XLT6_9EURY|nr:hypothetical protein [Natronolimnohabitans innermongolicus]ELY61623.1 hypothetical protein C493_02126 [Natronolimnohabitans innermongolicus JCM 12255]